MESLPAEGRAFCPRCGRKYAVPAEELRRRPGLRFTATCRSCDSSFGVVWRGGELATDLDEPGDEPRDERDILPRGTRLGRYEVEALLDTGGSGSVYKVFDAGANRHVALKVLRQPPDSEFGRRFRREVEVQGNVKHPNVMPIFDHGEIDGKPYYTMELLHKPVTLETIVGLFRSHRLGYHPALRTLNSLEGLVRHMLLPVARAIDFVNRQHGIVHRDLKPSNVLLDGRTLRVYVIDFGICHAMGPAGGRLVLRAHESAAEAPDARRVAMGTLRCMPPEQARGEVSPQGDVWALGALLYFLLAGDFPVAPALDLRRVNLNERIRNLERIAASCRASGDTEEAAFYETRLAELKTGEIRTKRDVIRDTQEGSYLPLPADADPLLSAVAKRAMAKEPAMRYPDAEAFAADLRAWLDGRPVRAYARTLRPAAATLYAGRLFARRHRTPLLVAAAALAAFAGVGLFQLVRSESSDDRRIAYWMDEAHRENDLDVRKEFLNRVLALRPEHAQAKELLAHTRAFEPLAQRVRAAREARGLVAERLRRRQNEAAEQLAQETAAVLERSVLPDLAAIPGSYPGRAALETEARELADFLRGRRSVDVRDAPEGVEVLLVPPRAFGARELAWNDARSWGRAPLPAETRALEPGSYVLLFRRDAHEVCLPITITRAAPRHLTFACPLDPAFLPPDMVHVAGRERMTYGDARFVARAVTVEVRDFLLDAHEVTNAAYARYVNSLPPDRREAAVPRRVRAAGTVPLWTHADDGTWHHPEGAANHPVTGVSWADAMDYARFAGKRLPTPQEWERAARGADDREYPYGAALDAEACNAHTGSVSPVGGFPRDRSPFGAYDMAGNVAEWTAETHPDGRATVKGGSFDLPRFRTISSSFERRPAAGTYPDVGFRCARDAP